MKNKKWGFNKNDFTIFIGDDGWFIHPINKEYYHLIITHKGIFFNGELIAKGKLELINNYWKGEIIDVKLS